MGDLCPMGAVQKLCGRVRAAGLREVGATGKQGELRRHWKDPGRSVARNERSGRPIVLKKE